MVGTEKSVIWLECGFFSAAFGWIFKSPRPFDLYYTPPLDVAGSVCHPCLHGIDAAIFHVAEDPGSHGHQHGRHRSPIRLLAPLITTYLDHLHSTTIVSLSQRSIPLEIVPMHPQNHTISSTVFGYIEIMAKI